MTPKQNPSTFATRRRLLRALAAGSAVGLAGCSSSPSGSQNGTNGSDGGNATGGNAQGQQGSASALNFAQVKSPVEFDPIVLNDVPSAQVVDRIVEGLYTYNRDATEVVPNLATSQPEVTENSTVYTVSLAENATFHNGDPVTAEDVKYSFEAPVREDTENATELNMIETVEVVDEKTARFRLKYPYAPFMQSLTWYVVPKSVREADKEAFNRKPIGSGPFKFVDWREGQFVSIERWDDYWGDPKPNLQRVEFRPVEEATTRVTTLRNGENDIIEEIPPKLWSSVEQMNRSSIQAVNAMGYYYLAFNCKQGPTTDPKVREAVDYCFDMDQAVSNFVEPTGVRQYSPLPQTVAKNWNMPLNEWKQIPHGKNIQKAKQLFNEAGVDPNYSWRIIVPPDDKREQIGVSVANGLKEAGFDSSVQRLDWGAFLDQYVSGNEDDYNMYTLGWSGAPDPDGFTYYFFTEEAAGVTDGSYYTKVSDQIVEARRTPNHDKRRQLYIDAITTLLQDRAHIPSYNLKNSYGVSQDVSNFAAHPTMSFGLATDWANVSLSSQ